MKRSTERGFLRIKRIGFVFVGVFLPLLPLLYAGGSFNNDWINNIWQLGYFGEYLRQHGSFPEVFNTSESVGFIYPVFYGYLLYPLLGLLSAFTGPSAALRLGVALLFLSQYWIVARLVWTVSQSEKKAFLIATLFSWSVYPLTNLYHRGAIPEFFATQLLVIAVCALCLTFWTELLEDRSKWLMLSAFAATLSFGSHPITAMLGAPLILLLAYTHFSVFQGLVFWSLGALTLSLAILSPWLYAVKQYLGEFSHLPSYYLTTEAFDAFWVRFFPLPLDLNALDHGLDLPTPFLDAQINLSLLILLGGLFFILRSSTIRIRAGEKRVIIWSLVGFVLVSFASFYYGEWNILPQWVLKYVLNKVQFAYRLTTYANIFILITVMGLLKHFSRLQLSKKSVRSVVILCWISLSVGAVGLVSKLERVFAVLRFDSKESIVSSNLSDIPDTVYGKTDFIVKGNYRELSESEARSGVARFPIQRAANFGEVLAAEVETSADGWVLTSIYPFPWNRIRVDGALIEVGQMALGSQSRTVNKRLYLNVNEVYDMKDWSLAVFLPRGKHRLEFQLLPELQWRRFRSLAVIAMGVLLAILLVLFLRPESISLSWWGKRVPT